MKKDQKEIQNSKFNIAIASLILGLFSVFILVGGVIIGLLFDVVGITSFITPTILFGSGAVICGIVARNKSAAENKSPPKFAQIGLITGALAILFAIITRVLVFVFFIPWLVA